MLKIKKFYNKNRVELIIIFIVMAVFYVQHLISLRLTMNFEEGRDANAYLLAMQGKLPYLDFDWVYGPFSFFIYPLIFKFFGTNLVVLRTSYVIFVSLVIPLVFFLSRRILPPIWAGIASFLAIAFFDVPYYTYNHIFAVLGELGCLLMLCRFIENKSRLASLIWTGVFTAIAILTKPFLSGLSLFIAVSFFLFFFNTKSIRNKFKNYTIFIIGVSFLILLYFLYFQARSKGMTLAHPIFSNDSLLVIDQVPKANPIRMLKVFLTNFFSIIPMRQLFIGFNFKKFLVMSLESFIFCLPIIICFIIFVFYILFKFGKLSGKIRKDFIAHKKFLFLFCIFSFFICQESLMTSSKSVISFIIQVPFILTVYLLYLIWLPFRNKHVITTVIFVFLCYLSFLHFVRYPISMFKKYTYPLNLKRASGILVSRQQKELYELLSSYLASNISKEDKIAVMGYYPLIGFLTEQKNIFEYDEYVFTKLNSAFFYMSLDGFIEKQKASSLFMLLENSIMNKIKKEKPKMILLVRGAMVDDFKQQHSYLMDYIARGYYIDRVFGPADIFGVSENEVVQWIEVYKYKNNNKS